MNLHLSLVFSLDFVESKGEESCKRNLHGFKGNRQRVKGHFLSGLSQAHTFIDSSFCVSNFYPLDLLLLAHVKFSPHPLAIQFLTIFLCPPVGCSLHATRTIKVYFYTWGGGQREGSFWVVFLQDNQLCYMSQQAMLVCLSDHILEVLE